VDGKVVDADTGLASPEEARSFELWLRGIWGEKEVRMERFGKEQVFISHGEGEREHEGAGESVDGNLKSEVVPIRQV
jgi:hypothetical protein